jgi:CTP:molybdopterin cytidylyltransferase MocA
MPAAIILAAGASKRLGRAKQTLLLAGETLLARAVRIAREAGLSPVLVVLGTHEFAQTLSAEANVVLNPEAHEGIASSIRAGVHAAHKQNTSGAVLMTCDQIRLTPQHLQQLIAQPQEVCGSAYAGKVGVPAYFPAAKFAELMALHGDRGAAPLLTGERAVQDEALAIDIDTEADLHYLDDQS